MADQELPQYPEPVTAACPHCGYHVQNVEPHWEWARRQLLARFADLIGGEFASGPVADIKTNDPEAYRAATAAADKVLWDLANPAHIDALSTWLASGGVETRVRWASAEHAQARYDTAYRETREKLAGEDEPRYIEFTAVIGPIDPPHKLHEFEGDDVVSTVHGELAERLFEAVERESPGANTSAKIVTDAEMDARAAAWPAPEAER